MHLRFPPDWLVEELVPNTGKRIHRNEEIVDFALDHPIGCPRLGEIVRPGEKITIIASDITRLFNRPSTYLAKIVRRLSKAGVKDKDLTILIATGMHRQVTEREKKQLVGTELYERFPVISHDCRNSAELKCIGNDYLGEPILLNSHAVDAERLIVTGGITLHGLTGFSGGGKSVLPGISGYDTIQRNHRFALDEQFRLKNSVKKGSLQGNPLVPEIQKAARLIGVDFLLNVISDSAGNYIEAVAGDVVEAHMEGCRSAGKYFLVPLKEKANLVVASVGGYPSDAELYQSVKAMENVTYATVEGGTILFLCYCSKGLGSEEWISWFELGSREKIAERLSREFSFPGFAAMKLLHFASKYRIILLSSLQPDQVRPLGLTPALTLDEAMSQAFEEFSSPGRLISMPFASTTVPFSEGLGA